jgi:steroid delta-isomerase-like uncharacterized protein
MRAVLTVLMVILIAASAIAAGSQVTAQEAATPVATPCPETSEDENEALARRWFEDGLNQDDPSVFAEILAEEMIHHGNLFPDRPLEGLEEVTNALFSIPAAFPDIQFTINAVITEGDLVVVRWTGTGTHLGEFQGIAPTGSSMTYTGMNMFRVECGIIVEGWSEPDTISLLRQIGGFEPRAEATPTP